MLEDDRVAIARKCRGTQQLGAMANEETLKFTRDGSGAIKPRNRGVCQMALLNLGWHVSMRRLLLELWNDKIDRHRLDSDDMLLSAANHTEVQSAIERVYSRALEVPGLILTEDDLKCHLFLELSKTPAFSTPIQTQENHILATPIHTEVSWFDEEQRLTIKPDITILSPEHLSILYSRGGRSVPPSKEFSFDGHAFIFELKFIRGPQDFTSGKLAEIQYDFDKIKSLFERFEKNGVAHETYCYFVVFTRYNRVPPAWNRFLEENLESAHWRLIYRTLNVPIPEYEA